MKYLWIDDERPVAKYFNNGIAKWATSYNDAIDNFLNIYEEKEKICISFDHDLSTDKSGYDFAKWLIEHKYKGYFHIHSMNPIGSFNIRQLLEHYGWGEVFYNIKTSK